MYRFSENPQQAAWMINQLRARIIDVAHQVRDGLIRGKPSLPEQARLFELYSLLVSCREKESPLVWEYAGREEIYERTSIFPMKKIKDLLEGKLTN